MFWGVLFFVGHESTVVCEEGFEDELFFGFVLAEVEYGAISSVLDVDPQVEFLHSEEEVLCEEQIESIGASTQLCLTPLELLKEFV